MDTSRIDTAITQIGAALTRIGLAGAVLSVVVGGIIYATSWGSSRQAETGKSAVIHAAIGSMLILSAGVLIGLVRSAFGG